MPDSGKFKDLYLNSAHTYPCQGTYPPFAIATGGVGPGYRQKGMGQHGQGDMPVPADPQTHLVLVQPHLLFGFLEGVFDDPPGAGHEHQFRQRYVSSTKTGLVGQVPSRHLRRAMLRVGPQRLIALHRQHVG